MYEPCRYITTLDRRFRLTNAINDEMRHGALRRASVVCLQRRSRAASRRIATCVCRVLTASQPGCVTAHCDVRLSCVDSVAAGLRHGALRRASVVCLQRRSRAASRRIATCVCRVFTASQPGCVKAHCDVHLSCVYSIAAGLRHGALRRASVVCLQRHSRAASRRIATCVCRVLTASQPGCVTAHCDVHLSCVCSVAAGLR